MSGDSLYSHYALSLGVQKLRLSANLLGEIAILLHIIEVLNIINKRRIFYELF